MQNQCESFEDLVDRIIAAVLDDLLDVENRAEMENAQHEEFTTIAARIVSQVLLRSTEIWEMTCSSFSFPSSLASETDLDSMLEAMAQSGFPTDLMRSHLDSTSRDIIKTIEGAKITLFPRKITLNRMMKRIRKKVKAFLTASKELVKNIGTEIKKYSESASSSILDLTISCTHDVVDGIIQVCHPNGGGQISEQGVQEVMQELSTITGSSRSSSEKDVEVIDLEENNETSVPVIGEAASSQSQQDYESLLYQKVKCAVSKALHKTSAAVSAHNSRTFEDITVEDLEVYEEQPGASFKSSALIESAVLDITEMIVEDFKKVSSHNGSVTEPESSRKTFQSAAAKRIYQNVHSKVFRFLLRLQESHSETEETIPTSAVSNEDQSAGAISPPPHLDEGSVSSVVECKSEPVLSITPEEPRRSNPFFVFRRVKKIVTRTFSAIRRALPSPFQCLTGSP